MIINKISPKMFSMAGNFNLYITLAFRRLRCPMPASRGFPRPRPDTGGPARHSRTFPLQWPFNLAHCHFSWAILRSMLVVIVQIDKFYINTGHCSLYLTAVTVTLEPSDETRYRPHLAPVCHECEDLSVASRMRPIRDIFVEKWNRIRIGNGNRDKNENNIQFLYLFIYIYV